MKSVRTTVSLPSDQYQELQQIAESNGLSISWVIRQAVGDFLTKHSDFKPLAKGDANGGNNEEMS